MVLPASSPMAVTYKCKRVTSHQPLVRNSKPVFHAPSILDFPKRIAAASIEIPKNANIGTYKLFTHSF